MTLMAVLPLAGGSSTRLQVYNLLNAGIEPRKVILRDAPHLVEVDAEVSVHNGVSHRGYRAPRDIRMSGAKVVR